MRCGKPGAAARTGPIVGASALLLLISIPADAYLGGNYASVQSDRRLIQGQLRSTPTAAYDVHEITAASGITVREYVSRAGTVFALTWRGPVLPNLRQLLDTYFVEYVDAMASPRPGALRHANVERPGLVVHSDGHLRAFSGRAYVPALVPDSVYAEQLP
jgi:hypothetical protein